MMGTLWIGAVRCLAQRLCSMNAAVGGKQPPLSLSTSGVDDSNVCFIGLLEGLCVPSS